MMKHGFLRKIDMQVGLLWLSALGITFSLQQVKGRIGNRLSNILLGFSACSFLLDIT